MLLSINCTISSVYCSGHVKDSNKKDCVLIIDQETGEITIERLASQVIIIN